MIETEEARMRILYCLYNLRQKHSDKENAEGKSFHDYARQFMLEKESEDEKEKSAGSMLSLKSTMITELSLNMAEVLSTL
jgi:hypothetical protein